MLHDGDFFGCEAMQVIHECVDPGIGRIDLRLQGRRSVRGFGRGESDVEREHRIDELDDVLSPG